MDTLIYLVSCLVTLAYFMMAYIYGLDALRNYQAGDTKERNWNLFGFSVNFIAFVLMFVYVI